MANSTKAFGLRPLGKVGGAYSAGSQTEYEIADNASTSIFQGDLVALSGGYVVPVTSSATGSILGVFNGCLIESDPDTGKPTFRNNYTQTNVTEGKIKAFIIDDPDQLYLVKSTGTATGITSVGTAFDILYAAGDSNNGVSGSFLNLAHSTNGQLLITGLDASADNEAAESSENFVVKIAKGQQLI